MARPAHSLPSLTLLLLVSVASAAGPLRGTWDPRLPGPFSVAKPVHLKANTVSQGPPFNLWGFLPEVPGEYPVAAFVPGFMCDPSGYSTILSHIASYGIAVVGVELPMVQRTLENSTVRSEHVAASFDFMLSDGGVLLASAFEDAGGPGGLRLDTTNRFMVMAHSIGGHTLLRALEKISCFGAKLAVMFDPVDGLDPFGLLKDYLIPLGLHPEVHFNFTMPLGLIMSGHGADPAPYPKILHPPACAPRDRSDLHWYDSMQAPKWLVNVTDFGHAEVIDEGLWEQAMRAVCRRGPGASSEEARASYRSTVAGLVVAMAEAFMDVPQAPAVPLDERLRWLEEPTTMLAPVRATGTFDRGTQMQAGCRHRSEAGKAADTPTWVI